MGIGFLHLRIQRRLKSNSLEVANGLAIVVRYGLIGNDCLVHLQLKCIAFRISSGAHKFQCNVGKLGRKRIVGRRDSKTGLTSCRCGTNDPVECGGSSNGIGIVDNIWVTPPRRGIRGAARFNGIQKGLDVERASGQRIVLAGGCA